MTSSKKLSRSSSAPARRGGRQTGACVPRCAQLQPRPTQVDNFVTPGWASHPSRPAVRACKIPESYKGRGVNAGFRDTWLDESIRDRLDVPGFPPSKEQNQLSRRRRPASAGVVSNLRRPTAEALDAKLAMLKRATACTMPTSLRSASFSNLREVPSSMLPSSFQSPGPGAYTQYADFS